MKCRRLGCRLGQVPRGLGQRRRWRELPAVAADHGDDGVDLDGGAGLGLDFGEDARGGRGDLGVDLVGGDFKKRLVALDFVSYLLEPLGNGAFEDGLAHLRHDDFGAGPEAAGRRPLGAAAGREQRLGQE